MSGGMHIVSVVGARPQFVKLAPLSRVFSTMGNVRHTIVHTGQHYDDNMSQVFFSELQIPQPDVNLDIGSSVPAALAGRHGVQTGRMLEQLEHWFLTNKPDVVLVYGDTNSTLAACFAATKIHIPVAHIEAGLRSFNRRMPEEHNRVATADSSDRLYAPTPAGIKNLKLEGLASRSVFSGDVMRDAVMHNMALGDASDEHKNDWSNGAPFGILTLHRPANTEPAVLISLLQSLDDLAAQQMQLVFPVHPRTRNIIDAAKLKLSSNICLVDPLPYLSMLNAVKNASVVLTDSGGLQKEATFLGTQCITLRDETEWTETIEIGVNRLVGTSPTAIEAALTDLTDTAYCIDDKMAIRIDEIFGKGDAASIIAEDLMEFFA